MILARHAEALLWVGRYLERAETTARCLQVADSLIIHLQPDVARAEWAQLVRALGLVDEFAEAGSEPRQRDVLEFLLASPDTAGSVPAAISAVRENLRVARDRVPIELWEEANRLHLTLRSLSTANVVAEPNDTLVAVRRGCQAMSGVVGEAMGRDEGHAFIVLGRMIERCLLTVDLLRAEVGADEGSFDADRLLRSSTSLQAFRRTHGYTGDWLTVSAFLVGSTDTPRSVLSSLRRAEERLVRIADEGTLAEPRRLTGLLRSEVEFSDLFNALAADPMSFLGGLHDSIAAVADSVQRHIVPPIGLPQTHAQFVRPGDRSP